MSSQRQTAIDAVDFARQLIRCPSVTPVDAGALDALQAALEGLGFTCHRLPFVEPDTASVDNLYARIGDTAPNFCYAGHTDVVPVGDADAWSVDPFGAELRDACLVGRGTVDMKGAIAAFVAAVSRYLPRQGNGLKGSISLLITGDEEAEAINGTRKVLDWLDDRGETLDACLVGEPSSNERLGDMIKIGRRGSLTGSLTVNGIQGHTAYPQLADNPAHHLVRMLDALITEPLDDGSEFFPPSNLQLTTIDIGNPASNVIPAKAAATFNIRFNDHHSGASLGDWIRRCLDGAGKDYDLRVTVSGEAFLSPPGRLSEVVCAAIEASVGAPPELGTTGGTSDARFIKDHCPVAELGLLNATAHKVDEHSSLDDIIRLSEVYEAVLDRFFAG